MKPRLLLINSSDDNAFVSLFDGERMNISYASEFQEASLRKQPDNLISCLYKIASSDRELYESVNAVAVTTGPGSFTGIRVGLAIAKGAADALCISAIGITCFDLMCRRIPQPNPEIKYCLLIPAKLPEYYYSIREGEFEIEKGCIEINRISSVLNEKMTIVGNFDNDSVIKHSYFTYINSKDLSPEPDAMLSIALDRFENKDISEAGRLEPLYLKEFRFKKLH